ncbi:MAG TPA: chemotaxis protein CheW [Actinoplanes sp.]|nr:chemotaxis protein CheW [Actinoplanes sp.]
MSGAAEVVADRLAELRSGFDQSFAEPPRRHDLETRELLAIQAGGRRYVLRLSQTSGVFCDRPITALPGPVPALLGLAGFSGTIVPVYDLAALLGHPMPDPPRWLVLAAGSPPLALAFHQLDGHLRVARETLVDEAGQHHDGGPRRPRGCLRGMAMLPEGTRAVVDVPSVRTAVQALTGHANEER